MLPRPQGSKLPRPAKPVTAEAAPRPSRVLASSRAPAQLQLFGRMPLRRT